MPGTFWVQGTTHLLVEDEDEAGEAAHAAVLVELLLYREDLRLAVFILDLLLDLPAITKQLTGLNTS